MYELLEKWMAPDYRFSFCYKKFLKIGGHEDVEGEEPCLNHREAKDTVRQLLVEKYNTYLTGEFR